MLKITKELPDINELVIFKTKQLHDSYAIVDLIEYELEGLLLFSEVSKKRIKSISKELPLNKLEVAIVTKVDQDKKLIDLSRKRVSYDEIMKTKDEYYKRKNIESIINEYSSDKTKIKELIEYLFKIDNWFDVLVDYCESENQENNLLSQIDKTFLDICKKKIIKRFYKATSIISITCYSENGIEIIKNSLKQGLIEGIEIFFISSPEYSISFKSTDKEKCIESIKQSIQLITNYSTLTKVSLVKEIDFNEINRHDISDQS